MHFPTCFLLALSTLSTLTLAAECSSDTGSTTCLDTPAAYDLRQQYCGSTIEWYTTTQRVGFASSGYIGQVRRTGDFVEQQECWDILDNIISTCLGHSNSGSWTYAGFSVHFDFCLNLDNLQNQ
jgi:endonuclease I